MTENLTIRLFEHNNWANLKLIGVCSALSDKQLDAAPVSATKGNIRQTLQHLVAAQERYVTYLSGVDHRSEGHTAPTFEALTRSANKTGQALLALAQNVPQTRAQTKDGYLVESWVLLVQAINHATEHREQISSMLTALGITPPELDGWSYGEVTHALIPPTNPSIVPTA